ncbi:hypothetical protein NDN08_000157 [Rhodosorus marinus]|uniref:PRELI/MSF1 domain-containing protein n=1 Tax=Rhodosorus marinus TaxID=101924 RepID=A0AAV8UEG4_9RHOD|nr:hypothetical protein NDN08_000157 [Rhodosorus marinus]
MVKRLFQEYVYQHPWAVVTEATWLKYPNPFCPHVLDVDVISRRVDDNDGFLKTRRLFTATSPVPRGLRWLMNSDVAYAVEDSVVDPVKQRMELNLRSLTFGDIVEMRETSTFEPHPENSEWTLLKQHWSCEWKVSTAFVSSLEKLSVQRFLSSVANGRLAVKQLCQDIEQNETPNHVS